jgi:hypothetical protein
MDRHNTTREPLRRPGFGLPIDEYAPRERFKSGSSPFDAPKSQAFETFFDRTAPWLTMLELWMLAFMNSITDRDGWREKVYNEEIISKWRQEAGEDPPVKTPEKAFEQVRQQPCFQT